MENNDKNKTSKIGYAVALTRLARTWKNKTNVSMAESTTSAIIYTNVAEFLALSLLKKIEQEINKNCPKIKINLQNNKQPTNLDFSIKQLELFSFENKSEILQVLTNIKDQRNKLFHNMLFLYHKNIKPDSCIKNIQTQTEKLIIMLPEVLIKILDK
jgi:hypothetical protein